MPRNAEHRGSAPSLLLVLGFHDSPDGYWDLACASDEREAGGAAGLRVDCDCPLASVLRPDASRPEPEVRISPDRSVGQSGGRGSLRLVH